MADVSGTQLNAGLDSLRKRVSDSAIIIAPTDGIDPFDLGHHHPRCALASLNAPVIQRSLMYADQSDPNALAALDSIACFHLACNNDYKLR